MRGLVLYICDASKPLVEKHIDLNYSLSCFEEASHRLHKLCFMTNITIESYAVCLPTVSKSFSGVFRWDVFCVYAAVNFVWPLLPWIQNHKILSDTWSHSAISSTFWVSCSLCISPLKFYSWSPMIRILVTFCSTVLMLSLFSRILCNRVAISNTVFSPFQMIWTGIV